VKIKITIKSEENEWDNEIIPAKKIVKKIDAEDMTWTLLTKQYLELLNEAGYIIDQELIEAIYKSSRELSLQHWVSKNLKNAHLADIVREAL
jgi:uncharacterized protein YeaO (DUF488 family)